MKCRSMKNDMSTLYQKIVVRFSEALQTLFPGDDLDPLIRESKEAKFGDYQANAVMGLAKRLGKNPRELAAELLKQLELKDLCDKVEVAGPGFINLTLAKTALAAFLETVKNDERLGVARVEHPVKHIIDFSSPNLAKEMHIGHLRTTVTGESIARIIEFMGHPLERVNHIGDWGTQFGMLIEHVCTAQPDVLKNPAAFQIADLESFYKVAKKRFDEEAGFADAARKRVVALQAGDPEAKKLWQIFVQESLRHCHEIYNLLDVTLTDVGESFYNDRLAGIVEEFKRSGLAKVDGGAVCVFLDGFVNRDGEPLPMIIQKSDGGYNYDTTDLAAIKYRIQECGGRQLIYVTDLRQAQHFDILFAAARKIGWASESVQLRHIGYGMILGQDRKPFKTRDGGTVKLIDVIRESVARSREIIRKNRTEAGQNINENKIENIAEAAGLAAVKYFDLSHNLSSDYVFHWDHMLAMDGNTGPYMLYAHARIQSIGRKSGLSWEEVVSKGKIILDHPSELALAKRLAVFADVVATVATELKPNLLTEYLFSLAKAFSGFYDKNTGVPILEAPSPELKLSRLLLCHLTARTLKLGLSLLSIGVVDEM